MGAALGLTLLLKRRGIIVARRLLVLAAFGLRAASRRTLVDGALLAGRVDAHAPPPIQIRVRERVLSAVASDDDHGAEQVAQRRCRRSGSRCQAHRGGAAMMCFRITPLAWYPRSAEDAAALVEQYANYLATLSGPWRFLSFTRTFTLSAPAPGPQPPRRHARRAGRA